MVQRTVGALAGTNARSRSTCRPGPPEPARDQSRIPTDLATAVDIGLHGARRRIDVGVMNGERRGDGGRGLRRAHDSRCRQGFQGQGRAARVCPCRAKNLKTSAVKVRIKVDGDVWFDDRASCVLFGNVGKLFGGLTTFENAPPTTAVSSSEWSPPRVSGNGHERSHSRRQRRAFSVRQRDERRAVLRSLRPPGRVRAGWRRPRRPSG